MKGETAVARSGASLSACFAAYAAAGATAFGIAFSLDAHPILVALCAQIGATTAIFCFSRAFDNSSLNDPLWSVAPLPIALYWMSSSAAEAEAGWLRPAIVLGFVGWWGVRLTYNWWRAWEGLDHEDWRYRDQREQFGRLYWPMSLVGIHLAPALLVFAGCLPLYAIMAVGARTLGPMDLFAGAVTAGAIAIESRADRQLVQFKQDQDRPDEILSAGLWSRCRHPNYLGEMGFWWGLAFFGLAANPDYWWTCVGALAISVMFRTISLHLMDTRMLTRRPEYAEHMERTPAFIPRLIRPSRPGV